MLISFFSSNKLKKTKYVIDRLNSGRILFRNFPRTYSRFKTVYLLTDTKQIIYVLIIIFPIFRFGRNYYFYTKLKLNVGCGGSVSVF